MRNTYMIKTLIFAGSYKEFINCIDEHRLKKDECIYVNNPRDYYGTRGYNVIRYGTWDRNEQKRELLEDFLNYYGLYRGSNVTEERYENKDKKTKGER